MKKAIWRLLEGLSQKEGQKCLHSGCKNRAFLCTGYSIPDFPSDYPSPSI